MKQLFTSNNNLKKGIRTGFTIIELLVVVSIISVLTSIVLVNVTQYITKGKDAAARGDLSSMQIAGATYYDTNSNYNGWTASVDYLKLNTALTAPSMAYTLTSTCDTANCIATATKWCAQINLKYTTNTYCVDSGGNKLDKAGGTCTGGVCG